MAGTAPLPRPTFRPTTRVRGGLGLARVYSGDLGITAWRAVTCITWPPEDDGMRCFSMAFRGQRTLMVGRPGVRAPILPLPLDTGLLEGDDARAGDDRREGEAGQPPLGRAALVVAYWPGGDARVSAMGIGSMIRRL